MSNGVAVHRYRVALTADGRTDDRLADGVDALAAARLAFRAWRSDARIVDDTPTRGRDSRGHYLAFTARGPLRHDVATARVYVPEPAGPLAGS